MTLISGDLRGIVRARRLSVATMRNIRQNLAWAFAYNLPRRCRSLPESLYPLFGMLLLSDDRQRRDESEFRKCHRERAASSAREP